MRKRPPGAKRIGKLRRPEVFRREGHSMPMWVPPKDRMRGMREAGDVNYYRPEVGSVWSDRRVPERFVLLEGVTGYGVYGVQWLRGRETALHWKARWEEFCPNFVLRVNAVSPSKNVEKQFFGKDKVER